VYALCTPARKVNWMAEGHLHIYLLYTLQECHKLMVWQHKRKEICFVYQRKLACRVRAGPKELFVAVFAKIEESTRQKWNNFHLQLKEWNYCSIWTLKNHMIPAKSFTQSHYTGAIQVDCCFSLFQGLSRILPTPPTRLMRITPIC